MKAPSDRSTRRRIAMAEEEAIKTAFYDVQAAIGAEFAPEGGWWWTDSFGDVEAEYHTVREGVGMWDVSPLNKWDWRGARANDAAQRGHTHPHLRPPGGPGGRTAVLDAGGALGAGGAVFHRAHAHRSGTPRRSG